MSCDSAITSGRSRVRAQASQGATEYKMRGGERGAWGAWHELGRALVAILGAPWGPAREDGSSVLLGPVAPCLKSPCLKSPCIQLKTLQLL
jgi:hypothetical protein